MAEIVVLGAGLGGSLHAYEIAAAAGPGHHVTLIGEQPNFQFTPSNPWVAVGWRKPAAITVDLRAPMRKRGITFHHQGAERVEPEQKRVRLRDGGLVAYDYLVIATGPELAFDEISGLGPDAHTHSICTTPHASAAFAGFEALCAKPGPVIIGAAPGASCFGPAYEFALILDTELRRRRLRDQVPMHYITPEPYIGHLGLDGVGDTKSLLESELRGRHIRWITDAKITAVEPGRMLVDSIGANGAVTASHALDFAYAMILPAFRGVAAVRGISGLSNPRGFILADSHQQNPAYPEIYAIGVCVAIPPLGQTAVPVGVPKTGFMIESMSHAVARNIAARLRGQPATAKPSLNAVCLADFGDGGVAFVAQPQIPPRNVNWSADGKWVHLAKVGFEKYFLRKIARGQYEPFYERFVMERLGIDKLKKAS